MRFLFAVTTLLLPFICGAQYKDQNEILAGYKNGNYTIFRNDQGKLDKVAKQWPVEISRGADNKVQQVLVKRAGVVDETFIPDLPEQPGYFSFESAKLIFFENYAVYYKQVNGYTNSSITFDVLYELVPDNGSSKSLKAAAEDIAAYRAATLSSQGTARQEIAKNKEAAEIKDREASSTKGKNVTALSFEAVDIPSSIGLLSKLKFGIIATLADGSKLKTKNLGGKSEFEDSYTVDAPGCSFADGVLEVGIDGAAFPNDEVVITVTDKNNPTQSVTRHITLDYGTPFFTYSTGADAFSGIGGNSGSDRCPDVTSGKPGAAGPAGGDGGDMTIKIKEIKHRKTGAVLYQYEIFKHRENQTIRMKSSPSAPVTLVCNGGKGGEGGSGGRGGSSSQCGQANGGDGGNGGRGGRGGNITIIRGSNSINAAFFRVQNDGGNGGNGGRGGRGLAPGSNGSNGAKGNDGSINPTTGAVNFNW